MSHKDHSLTEAAHFQSLQDVEAASYRCGYCSNDVSSAKGLRTEQSQAHVRVCPHCNGATFFDVTAKQWPGAKPGAAVANVPDDIAILYEEARLSLAANAFTGSVMLCRKIMMHCAVERGAKANKKFAYYVEWLVEEGHAPKSANKWLEYIRIKANEANHEIMVMTKAEAEGILKLTASLLEDLYELPYAVPAIMAGLKDSVAEEQ